MKDGAGFDGSDDALVALRARLLERWEAEQAGQPDRADQPAPFVPTELVQRARALAATDVSGEPDDALLAAVADVDAARRALDATAAHLGAELEARSTTLLGHGLRTRSWLGRHLGLRRGAAAAQVRVGQFLRHHDHIDAALADGRLTLDHASLLERLTTPRVAEVVAAIQPQLVALAAGVTFETWAREVRALLDLADADGGHRPRPDSNRLSVTDGDDGAVHLHGCFTGDLAVEVRAALAAEADRQFHRHRCDAEATGSELHVPPRHVLLALAFVELCRAGRAGTAPSPSTGADVSLVVTTPPGWASALVPAAIDGAGDDDWLAGLLTATLDGLSVDRSTARLLCCDARFRLHVEDPHGVPLHHGRARAHATPAQRRAAAVRFGGCCFPGCDAPPSWAELHHVLPREDGGPTDQPNLAPLCRHHHRVLHRAGWSMRPSPDGFTITTAFGRRLHTQRHGRPPPQG